MTPMTTVTPGLWDALRHAGTRRELDEWLDHPRVDGAALNGNLRDLRLMNRWFHWSAAVWRDLERLLDRRGLSSATCLDVATGSADIPRDFVRRGRLRRLPLRLLASDISRPVLQVARQHGAADAAIELLQHDGSALPFRDGSVDVALCCLAAHHFAPEALERLMAEMWRVARHGVIVSDLTRGRGDYLAARLMALVLRNPLTAHDGPVSVLRAYTPRELRAMAGRAGLERVALRTHLPARMTLVAEKGPCQ